MMMMMTEAAVMQSLPGMPGRIEQQPSRVVVVVGGGGDDDGDGDVRLDTAADSSFWTNGPRTMNSYDSHCYHSRDFD